MNTPDTEPPCAAAELQAGRQPWNQRHPLAKGTDTSDPKEPSGFSQFGGVLYFFGGLSLILGVAAVFADAKVEAIYLLSGGLGLLGFGALFQILSTLKLIAHRLKR